MTTPCWMQVTASNVKAVVKVDASNPSRKGNAGMLTIQDPNSSLDGYDVPFIAEEVVNTRRGIFQGDLVEVMHTVCCGVYPRVHPRVHTRSCAHEKWFTCCWCSAT